MSPNSKLVSLSRDTYNLDVSGYVLFFSAYMLGARKRKNCEG